MAHKDICKKFKVDKREYEAVGFLKDHESSVLGDAMLERVPGAIGEEEWEFLLKRRNQFPAELRRYFLATARRNPGGPRGVSFFSWFDDCLEWCQNWHYIEGQWHDNGLVLRRCV